MSLSVKGSALIDSYYTTRNDHMKHILDLYSDSELSQLKTLLDKYVQSSVLKSDDVDVVCMVCNGTYGANCGLNEATDGHCEYLLKKEVA